MGEVCHTRLLSYNSVGGWKTIWDWEVCVCVRVCSSMCCVCMRVCTYLAASVCANACLSTGVSVWPASRLLAIMRSTVVVRGILAIASNPQASTPRCITDRRVTHPKWHQLLDWQSLLGEPHRRNQAAHTVKCGRHLSWTLRRGILPYLLNLSLNFSTFNISSNRLPKTSLHLLSILKLALHVQVSE